MASADLDKARSRFILAVKRIAAGLQLQRDRLAARTAQAPRLMPGTEYEIVDLSGAPDNDLDYYVYELGRLQDAARTVIEVFDRPAEIVLALDEFNAAVPNLRKARNPLTHPSDDPRLDDVAWFSAVVKLGPNGSVQYLVDPRHGHHDAAERLAASLLHFLRAGLRTSTTPSASEAP